MVLRERLGNTVLRERLGNTVLRVRFGEHCIAGEIVGTQC